MVARVGSLAAWVMGGGNYHMPEAVRVLMSHGAVRGGQQGQHLGWWQNDGLGIGVAVR